MQSHTHFRENKLANRGLRPVTSRLNAPGSWSTEVPSSKDDVKVGRRAEFAVLPLELEYLLFSFFFKGQYFYWNTHNLQY